MIANKQVIRLIFGLKIKELRKQRGYSFAELSERCGLSVSYLNEIEKGKKYPKTDKILALSEALDVSYDHLVSLKLSKKLSPVADLLRSNFLQELPLDFFGLELSQLMELITNAPTKINAFISTLIEIARNYEMQQEQFYFAAIRSYQELNDNYLEDIETAVDNFIRETNIDITPPVKRAQLYDILRDRYGYTIDKETLGNKPELEQVRSIFNKKKKILMIKPSLTETQKAFLLGRELAFNYLKLEKRPYFTPFLKVNSFEEALNNLKASYFAVALLINQKMFKEDIEELFDLPEWTPEVFTDLLAKYKSSPEMFHQRLTNILPKHFGIRNLFMLRFSTEADSEEYFITKELHLAKLHSPHANEINEHYCRRWVSLNILKDLRQKQLAGQHLKNCADVQRSRYVGTKEEFLCISMARPNFPTPGNVSVTTGLLIDDKMRKKIRVVANESVPYRLVNDTCERCPIEDCLERAAPPLIIEKELYDKSVEKAISGLMA